MSVQMINLHLFLLSMMKKLHEKLTHDLLQCTENEIEILINALNTGRRQTYS